MAYDLSVPEEVGEGLIDKVSQLLNLENIFADLEQRFEDLKRGNLTLNIQLHEWRNKYALLEKIVTTTEAEGGTSEDVGGELRQDLAKVKLESKHLQSVAEKGKAARERNKHLATIKSELESYYCQFNEFKRRFQRLPEREKNIDYIESLGIKLQEVSSKYAKYLRNLDTEWLTAEVQHEKEKVDTEQLLQTNFLKSLEGSYLAEQELNRIDSYQEQTASIDIEKHLNTSPNIENKAGREIIPLELVPNVTTKSNKMPVVPLTEMLKIVNSTVPEYAGCSGPNSQQELGRFIDCCEMLNSSYRDQEENQALLLMLLKMKFRADAYDLVNRATFNTLDELKQLLFKTYLPSRSLVEISEELQRCTQRPTETIKEFMRRIRGVLNDWSEQMKRCHKDVATQKILFDEKEKEVILVFNEGLNNIKLRDYLMMNKKETLDGIEDAAVRFEETARLYTSKDVPTYASGEFCRAVEHKENSSNQGAMPSYQYNRAPPPDYNNQTQPSMTMTRNRSDSNNYEGAYNRRGIRCSYCNFTGHYRSQCRKLETNGFCRNCKKTGIGEHTALKENHRCRSPAKANCALTAVREDIRQEAAQPQDIGSEMLMTNPIRGETTPL